MKIEEYKNKQVTTEDISYLESVWDEDKNHFIIELNDIYPLFEDLIIDKKDRLSFIKLKTICQRIIRNNNDKKAFDISLKIIYKLIGYGEEGNKKQVDYVIDSATASLYYILASIIYDGEINFIPSSSKAREFDIEKDSELALEYLKKAYSLDPINKNISSTLAYHYLSTDDYYKAYAYYPRNNDEFLFGRQDVNAYTILGCKLDEDYKNGNAMINEKMIFECYYNAYKLSKECGDLDDDEKYSVYYNMAYCYIKGIYVKENVEKGKKYLHKIGEYFAKKGKDISLFDDPDGLMKDYYKL